MSVRAIFVAIRMSFALITYISCEILLDFGSFLVIVVVLVTVVVVVVVWFDISRHVFFKYLKKH